MTNSVLIIGASSQIAKALMNEYSNQFVVSVSRQQNVNLSANKENKEEATYQSDYSEQSIAEITEQLTAKNYQFIRVFICNGILHNTEFMPEKQLADLDAATMHDVFHANTVIPSLWLSALMPLLSKSKHCVITVFSARIGSIGDNRLGGWYSYRASKAALNMMLKSASIEYARKAKGVKLLSFHPGTTDTPLSKPFQKNVPANKLFTPEFVAKQLVDITQNLVLDGELAYLDWQGEIIQW